MLNWKDLPEGSPERVIMHGAWKAKRGRKPSMVFKAERNPEEALELALDAFFSVPPSKERTVFPFKGISLERGDVVVLQSKFDPPGPKIRGVVVGAQNGHIQIISRSLEKEGHDGVFSSGELDDIQVERRAKAAIIRESAKKFCRHEPVRIAMNGHIEVGRVVAALDGIVLAERFDGELIRAGAARFEKVSIDQFKHS